MVKLTKTLSLPLLNLLLMHALAIKRVLSRGVRMFIRNCLLPMAVISVAAFAAPVVASAETVTVTSVNTLPSATSWGVLPGENTGGGSGMITGTAARSGNGSLELRGDRSRIQMGIQYGGATGATNLMPLSNVTGLSFDWRIAGDSISGYNPDYTPALRLLVQDGNQRSELIWEGVYNSTYGNTVRDTWYSSSFSDNFYQFVSGQGVTTSGGSQVNKTLSSWIASNYSSNAFVSAISVGAGSGALATYHAFADNVSLGTISGVTTFNFERTAAAVPEPATWAMMLIGFGMIGATSRYRRRSSSAAIA